MSEKQTEALRLAGEYRKTMPSAMLHLWAYDVVGELRRQHARIAELEAQLEAVGAGGVIGPMMGCVSLSANAGEPVAWQYRSLRDSGAWFDCTKERFEMRCTQPEIWETRALYAAPPTAQALGCGAEPPGIQALMCVISSLRDIAHFSDEEGGELMSALCALRDWAYAQTAQAEGWRTIETAPKGELVLLWSEITRGEPFIGDWAEYARYNYPQFTHWSRWDGLPPTSA